MKEPPEELISFADAARLLGVSRQCVGEMIREGYGGLEAVSVLRVAFRVRRASVLAYKVHETRPAASFLAYKKRKKLECRKQAK